jgi:hypothetical protein
MIRDLFMGNAEEVEEADEVSEEEAASIEIV